MKIYIVLTYTGTILSRIIKYYTHCEFSHVSISLDRNLEEMYSFGRLNPYNPFNGGFVHEGIEIGTFKRFKNTSARIYSLEVTQAQYDKAEQIINLFKKEKEKYKFNILGLFAVSINLRLKRENYFYCAEFAKYLLEETEISGELPEIIKPEDFRNIQGLKLIYEGKLKEYNSNK